MNGGHHRALLPAYEMMRWLCADFEALSMFAKVSGFSFLTEFRN